MNRKRSADLLLIFTDCRSLINYFLNEKDFFVGSMIDFTASLSRFDGMDFCKSMFSQTNERSITHVDLFDSQLSRDLFDELNRIERFLTTEQIDSITLFTQIDPTKTISCPTTPLDQPFFNHLRFLPFFSVQY